MSNGKILYSIKIFKDFIYTKKSFIYITKGEPTLIVGSIYDYMDMLYSKKNKISLEKVVIILIVLIVFLNGLALFHSDSTLGNDVYRRFISLIIWFSMILVFAISMYKKIFILHIGIFLPFVYFLLFNFNNFEVTPIGFLATLELLLIILLKKSILSNAFRLYKRILLIMASFGIIFYLIFIIGVPVPYSTTIFYEIYTSSVYINYGLSFLLLGDGYLRLCGLFNEPGYFGTILALVLCTEKFNLKKKSNLIFFIAGCLTFSLAFYFIILIYLFLASVKSRIRFIGFVSMLVLLFGILPNIEFSNQNINNISNRLKIEDGVLVGDNRSNSNIDESIDSIFSNSEHFIFGYGRGYSRTLSLKGTSTFKSYIIDFGFIGFLLLFSPLVFLSLKRAWGNAYSLFYVFCFFLSVYQRPNVFLPNYILLLLGGIEFLNNKTTNQLLNQQADRYVS